MEKQWINEIIEKTHELVDAQTCHSETKAAAQRWLNAVGTAAEEAESKRYFDELEAAIMPIDTLIAFAQSKKGMEYFGADSAAMIAAHAIEIKEAGGKYCDCPACAKVAEILERKNDILK